MGGRPWLGVKKRRPWRARNQSRGKVSNLQHSLRAYVRQPINSGKKKTTPRTQLRKDAQKAILDSDSVLILIPCWLFVLLLQLRWLLPLRPSALCEGSASACPPASANPAPESALSAKVPSQNLKRHMTNRWKQRSVQTSRSSMRNQTSSKRFNPTRSSKFFRNSASISPG